ncbi:phosphatase PAP2 family protein [Devosia sp.]|uniref:phosphatase PAP2 family protein n=1 Tax=Devosia sp. TaxID=1871048 RepID=UPI003BA984BD
MSVDVRRSSRWPLIALITLTAALLGVFGMVADEALEGDTVAFDSAVTALFRTADTNAVIGPLWLQEAVRDFTSLGSFTILGLIVMASAVYLLLEKKAGTAIFLVVSVVAGTVISNVLKQTFNRPRPNVEASLSVFTASFPSGHAALSAVVYLTLGALLSQSARSPLIKGYLIGLALLMAFLVGVSRIYLGMHYPTDVIAGWSLGLSWAMICWVIKQAFEARMAASNILG